MGLDIIGAGMGRTGTYSTRLALTHLGWPCFHMRDMLQHADRVDHLEDLEADRDPDTEALFAGYTACVDFPVSPLWKELVEIYPEARVLLTVRDPEEWYESTLATLYPSSRDGEPPPPPSSDRDRVMHVVYRQVWDGIFERRFTDRDFAIERFQAYNDEVRETVEPERLLVWEVADGWEPLCRWLDVPEPDAPMPHTNTRREFIERLDQD